MKITVNKSAKRALSLVLAFVMLVGSLFTANIGAHVAADTTAPIKEGTIDLLEFGSYLTEMGSTSTYYDTKLADNGEKGTEDDPIIIDSAEEFVYLTKANAGGAASAGKYYKVADGIAGFDLSAGNLDLDGGLADNDNLNKIKNGGKNHAGADPGFQGNFDGNGVTVYGAVINGGSYAGIFPRAHNNVTIKNLNVKLCYFKGTYAGGIVGYHTADVIAYEKDAPMYSVTIENCTVTDTYLECNSTSWGTGVGAIIGRANSAPSWKEADKGVDGNGDGDKSDTIYVNTPYRIKNCFVDLQAEYFISTSASTNGSNRGGVVGACGSNDLLASDCIVLGVTPYATNQSASDNNVQHAGLESHFTNIYTDTGSLKYAIGGTLGTRDFTGRIFILTKDEMKGSAAVANLNLAWFSAWTPAGEGEYPTVIQTSAESDTYFWSGSAATEFAGGTGTKEDPYIIKTPDQLYLALTKITDSTNNVAGGKQTSQILKQGSTTEYVPVYTPNYYKVADGVKNFYLNNVYGNETLDGIKAFVAGGKAKKWEPQKSFVGHIDGNGVNIYGLYSSLGQGLINKLDGSADVKNFNFSACYSKGTGQAAILTTFLGSYSNDSTIINVSNVSVRNSYCESTSSLKVTTNASGKKEHARYAGGIVSTGSTCENFIMSNCFYDGYSCEIVNGAESEIPSSMVGGIISGGSGMNNVMLTSCVSLKNPVVDEAYISGTEFFYNRYDATQGFQVFFYDCYTDYENQICVAYPGKYDKLLKINRIDTKDEYELFDFATLAWGSNWELVEVEDGRVIPMPKVNTAENSVGSYVQVIGQDHNKYASVGPYQHGSNPFAYLLKGAGTEENPYIIETAEQLARAIATGGMNLYDRLFYKLGNDIDLSGGTWINQTEVHEGGIHYTYTPFGGTLDGAGHTVTGLSAADNKSAGLIPVLASTGVVKNLHVRDSFAVSALYAGILVGEAQSGSTISGCSVEGSEIACQSSAFMVGNDKSYIENSYYINEIDDEVYYVDENGDVYGDYGDDMEEWEPNEDIWYIAIKDGFPRLKNHAQGGKFIDIDGDGVASDYGASDLSALKLNLLNKSAYKNILGDVNRDGAINIVDLAVLQRTIVGVNGNAITDNFFANVQVGAIKIYYGENDNYDAARKIELYFENMFPNVDVKKVVSADKTVSGATSDKTAVYVHAGDETGKPDGKLEIIVGNIANYNAYKTNTVATAANTYAVTYDEANKVVWLQGENFTAVEQAVINFINGCDVDANTVYTCASTELEDYKKPITIKLDTNYDGTIDTNKTLYYTWGDEFNGDNIDTYNWQHNSQQSENSNGANSNYKDQEVAPVKDLDKVLVVSGGKLSMKRGFARGTNGYNSDTSNGYIALDVTPGEFNGYTSWDSATNSNIPAIDADGSDVYFSSGKVTTDRGMLYKQGYLEIEAQFPADGHAFPAWWLMGRPAQSQTNHGYDTSLYSKVYKLNDKWNGIDEYVATNLDTYKYQIPSAIYEIDMIEVMQAASRVSGRDFSWSSGITDKEAKHLTAVGWYGINSTVHKWWNNGVADNKLYIQDWDNYTVLGGIENSAFSTTSTAGSWIHNIGSTKYDFGSTANCTSVSTTARDKLQYKRKYGFSWYTDGVSGFEATLYIYDVAANGSTSVTTLPIASGGELNAFLDGNKKTEANGAIGQAGAANIYSDASVFNQYMYILLDNKYYSSNEAYTGGAKVFTDLLTAAGLTSFEIDYVRLYQQDGQRDIVTPETQNFNNNNHFGY